jgi:hypothetical protein
MIVVLWLLNKRIPKVIPSHARILLVANPLSLNYRDPCNESTKGSWQGLIPHDSWYYNRSDIKKKDSKSVSPDTNPCNPKSEWSFLLWKNGTADVLF